MEDRLGSDFSDVRVHIGDKAARSAAAVSATAYTVGSEVVFGDGSFDATSSVGRQRLAHELVHVQQQRQGPVSGTDNGSGVAISDPADFFEREAEATAARVASGPRLEIPGGPRGRYPGRSSVQLTGGRSVQRCGGMPCDCAADEQDIVQEGGAGAPALKPVQRAIGVGADALEGDPDQMPQVLSCPPAISDAPEPTEMLLFPNLGATVTPAQQAQIAAFVDNWVAVGGGATVRIDGFASKPGSEALNWQLSCERALAVKAELMKPLPAVDKGIPENSIELFMHGETAAFGDESQNRRVSLSMGPAPASPQPPSPQPTPPSPGPTPPACDPRVKDVTKLPGVMHANGWPHGEALLREWFSLPAGIAPGFTATDSTEITMDWVLTFERAKKAYGAIFADKAYVNGPARAEIATLLKKLGVDKGGVFDFAKPVTALDPDFDINFRPVGGLADDLDDLTASLGRFTFRMVVAGRVEPDAATGLFRVTVTDVGVHVRDSFDFNGSQPLGCWNVCTNNVGRFFCGGVDINNTDLDAWRKVNGKGGDMKILSDVKATHLASPDTFILP